MEVKAGKERVVRDEFMSILLKHPINALFPVILFKSGKETDVKWMLSAKVYDKASSPLIVVKLLKSTEVRELHLEKAKQSA